MKRFNHELLFNHNQAFLIINCDSKLEGFNLNVPPPAGGPAARRASRRRGISLSHWHVVCIRVMYSLVLLSSTDRDVTIWILANFLVPYDIVYDFLTRIFILCIRNHIRYSIHRISHRILRTS